MSTEVELLRASATARGIPVCAQKVCGYVGTHVASWVTGDIVGCEPHSNAFVRLGEIMGVPNVRVWRNPDAPSPPVPSKRFLAIGRALQDSACVVCGEPRREPGITCGDRSCTGDEYGDG